MGCVSPWTDQEKKVYSLLSSMISSALNRVRLTAMPRSSMLDLN
jgi:hypothetical protein